jgi:hypothetical protein
LKSGITVVKSDIVAMKANINVVNEAATEEEIQQSNKVVGSVNKLQLNIDWTPRPRNLPHCYRGVDTSESNARPRTRGERRDENPQNPFANSASFHLFHWCV